MVLTEQKFESKKEDIPKTEVLEETLPVEIGLVNLRLRFKPRAAYRLYDDYDETMIRRNEDGTLELNICFPEDEWVYGYLLSFGPDVEVLEPEHIRKLLRERMKEALSFYE